ncbi:MAG TPA: hypothetical protein VN914_12580 [Polyangia bacterium]|nr:hypothetical protein [Polyangia bacterium]
MKRASLLVLLLGACGSSSESAGPDGGGGAPDGGSPAIACAPIAEVTPTVCSMPGAARNVIFKNGCSEAVDIWWVNAMCGETFYQRLQPGMMYTQASFVTHPWRARTVPAGAAPGAPGGKLLKEFGAIPPGTDELIFALP